MLKLLLSRLATALPSIVGVVVVTFLLTRAAAGRSGGLLRRPGGERRRRSRRSATKLGLDQPLPEQFVAYLGDLAHGDLGNSLTTGQPVRDGDRRRACRPRPSSRWSRCSSPSAIAIPLGVLAAMQPGSLDRPLCRIVTTAGVSLPVFFTGLLLVYVFYFLLGWAPAPLGRLDVFLSRAARTSPAST